jgi:hypothetical protein
MNPANAKWPTRRPLWASFLLAALAGALLAGSALAAALIKNGSFEKDTNGDGVPNKWGGYLLSAADKRVCGTSAAGDCSFKMKADSNYKNLSQFVAQSGLDGDSFTFSAYIRQKDLVLGVGGARLAVIFNHTDGSDNTVFIEVPAGTDPWTYYSVTAYADENYDDILILIICESDSGKIWFDKVKLTP